MTGRQNSPEQGVRFDRDKFLAAIHHVIERCHDKPDSLGKTKLHKVMYYSDMLCFFATGRPITGVEYIKAPFGPTARYLDWGLDRLREDGLINFEKEEYFGLGKYVYRSKRQPQTNLLSSAEKALMDEVISFVCERSTSEISEYGHAQPWLDARMGERIPYSSAYMLVPGTQAEAYDLEWARDQREIVRQYRRA